MDAELSRRSLLRGSGALVVGFALAGARIGCTRAAAAPAVDQVDSWLVVLPNNTVQLRTSQIDPGNRAPMGLLAILAEELAMTLDQVSHARWDTNTLVSSGATSGSAAVQNGGPLVRAAGATAYQALLALASQELGVPATQLTVARGVVAGGGKKVSYGQLVGGKLLNASIATPQLDPGEGIAKPVGQYKIVGTRFPGGRSIVDKVTGRYTYVHNVHVPGMLHGRVVRPRGQGGYGTAAPIVSVHPGSIAHIPGAKVVRAGDFLGVVAPREYDAVQAAAQLKVVWKDTPVLPSTGDVWQAMRQQDGAGQTQARVTLDQGDVDAALKGAAKTVQQTYSFDGQGHMPIGPCCAVADVRSSHATIFSNTQAIEGLVPAIQMLLGFSDPSQVRALWYEGASSFGPGNRYVDTAKAAAIMSKLVGAPVRVQLMRWDEHGWDAYGPAQLMDLRGGIDDGGKLVAFDYTVLAQPSTSLDLTQELLGTLTYGQTALPMPGSIYPLPGTTNPNSANAAPMYDAPNRRLTGKTLPLFSGYFANGPLRDPSGPQTAFAAEQLIDELAFQAGMDPLEFRRANMSDSRWIAVLNAAAQAAGWRARVAGSVKQSERVAKGRGFAFGRHGAAGYAAAVVEVQVDKKTGVITVEHVYNALDAGLAVGLELVENQMIGASVQGVSRALLEEVRFDKTRVTSLDWVSYPILRFRDHPRVTNVILQRLDQVPLGAGEPSTTPIAPAIANAFFDATRVRIRQAPMSPARVRDVLKAAGVH